MKKDTRNKIWADFEREISKRAAYKDKKLVLRGPWKKFVRRQGQYKVYAVDGRWIRRNLCVYFEHGGHGLVHEFIPTNEIWVSTRHYDEGRSEFVRCGCTVKSKNQKVSPAYFESTVLHEMEENKMMKTGRNYWQSHESALLKERKIGLIKNPFWDL